jgi:MraZ protein
VGYTGTYDVRADEKCRITIPQILRDELKSPFIITKGFGKCLFAMSAEQWQHSFEEKFLSGPMLDTHMIRLERYFRNGLIKASPDAQGRVLLGPALREHSGIDIQSDVIVMGMSNRVEIWSKSVWNVENETLTPEALMQSATAVGLGRGGY